MLPPGRWALTPPFHPYQALSPSAIRLRGLLSGCLKVFLQMATEAHCTGGLFSVALSVAGNLASLARTARRVGPLALPGALPLGPRRRSPRTFVRGARRVDHGVRTFLPACLLAKAGPAITRPARHRNYIIMRRLAVRDKGQKDFAPTARRKTARGNALGSCPGTIPALKGRKVPAPFQGASPWIVIETQGAALG